ncbi:MAG: AraC family transcriptional regulator, partial [Miltoncostaeaceae bacterium]
MVESGHPTQIRPVDFASRRHPELPVEAIQRAELLARFGRDHFARPERVSFAALILVRAGTGRHGVDFEEIELRP